MAELMTRAKGKCMKVWAKIAAGIAGAILVLPALAGCTLSTSPDPHRAVVLVSGVASVTPFTTPTQACKSGTTSGSTWSYIRDYLVNKGLKVFTAPAMTGNVPVPATLTAAQGGPFGDCPQQPGLDVTINSFNSPIVSGHNLAAFITSLHDNYGVTQVDLVGHSLGGPDTRNAINYLQAAKSPVTITSLTTLGSPWEPAMLAVPPYNPSVACDGLAICEQVVTGLMEIPDVRPIVDFFQPAAFAAWTAAQTGVLDKIPVTLVAGTYFTKLNGNPAQWPNDGMIQFDATAARNISDAVLPQRACFTQATTHSAFIAEAIGAPASQGITWNEESALVVYNSVTTAGTPRQLANRLGCPPPTK